MKKHSLLLLCLLAATALRADQTPRPDIDQLLTASHAEATYEDTLKGVKAMMSQMVAQMSMAPGMKDKETAFANKVAGIVQNSMSWDKLKDQYVQAYSETYSPDETKQLIDFYNCPTGQMYLGTQPELTRKSQEVAMQEVSGMVSSSQQGGAAASPTPIPAPPNRPDLDELLQVSRIAQMSQAVMAKVAAMQQQQTAAGSAGAAAYQSMASPENLRGMYETIFAAVYTPDQVKQLIAFYKTPTGQMFLDRQPVLIQKTTAISQQIMTSLMPQIQQAVQQTMEPAAPQGGPAQ
jgi:hypothetical protein